MRSPRLLRLTTLAFVAACSRDRADDHAHQQLAQNQAPVATLVGAPVTTSDTAKHASLPDSLAGVPRFGAGIYELVAVRDVPLLDDSTAVSGFGDVLWDSLDSARDWSDTLRIVKLTEWGVDDEYELAQADSADLPSVYRRLLEQRSCIEWLAGASLRLEANGQFEIGRRYRKYCHGKTPAYTRSTTSMTSVLAPCKDPLEAPVAGMARHLTCRYGHYWDGVYTYRHVGDTLVLSSDCDGRDTYVLRHPKSSHVTVAAADAKMRTTDEC